MALPPGDQPTDNEKFFQEHGYYPTKYVPRKGSNLDQSTVGHPDPESKFGPFLSSASARGFHRAGSKWVRYIPKRARFRYCWHLEVRQSGKNTGKNGWSSSLDPIRARIRSL